MIDYQKLRDTNERLKPLRRFLDDLQSATDLIASAQQEMDHYTKKIGVLKDEQNGLLNEIEVIKGTCNVLQDDLKAKRHDYEVALAAEQASYQDKLAALLTAFQESQTMLEDEQRQAHAQHVQFMDSLAQSRSRAEADYEQLKTTIRTLREQLEKAL